MKKDNISARSPEKSEHLSLNYIDMELPSDKSKPTGPFKVVDAHAGELLLFVPRSETGKLVDGLTGKYGYSHLAIDCGEIDSPTGRRVMIEATVPDGVHYGFQDEYGQRQSVRIPLWKTGINVGQFCECVHARVGEKFDELEIITRGILDNPARQICSDLATVCLPEEMREEIARCHKSAVIHPLSAVRDERPGSKYRLFMSPNAFAEFLGAPRGRELERADQLAEPHIQESSNVALFSKLWKRSEAFMTSAWRRVIR